MMKSMIKVTNTNTNGTAYMVCPEKNVHTLIELLGEAEATYEVYESSNMPLEALPESVVADVKGKLQVFNEVNVVYEYGEFRASANNCLKAHYHYDHFVCGSYKAEEVYTAEERKQHMAELNSYEFPEWAW